MEFDPNSNPPCYKTVDEVRIFSVICIIMNNIINKQNKKNLAWKYFPLLGFQSF